jgi:hypothetical protein
MNDAPEQANPRASATAPQHRGRSGWHDRLTRGIRTENRRICWTGFNPGLERILILFLTGDWKVPGTRRLESLRYVSQLQNCSSRREEAPYSLKYLKYEPRYLGCYGVLKKPYVAPTFQSPETSGPCFPAKNSVKMRPLAAGGRQNHCPRRRPSGIIHGLIRANSNP